jgi:prepilin-type N-terminal cleavage/methylation domain-containing protein
MLNTSLFSPSVVVYTGRMYGRLSRFQGFTLVELMAVIGIIGILAGITIASLAGVRERASRATTLGALENARTGAAVCVLRGESLGTPSVNDLLCTGATQRWPQLGTGWTYDSPTSDPANRTFDISASRSSCTISCSEDTDCTEAC